MYCEHCGTRIVESFFCSKECEEKFYNDNPTGFNPVYDPDFDMNSYYDLGGEG